MIYELVLRNFHCSLEFVFSLQLLQPFNFSPVSFACNFQDWGCVILREIDFLLKLCWSIPCLHPSWEVHTCNSEVSTVWCFSKFLSVDEQIVPYFGHHSAKTLNNLTALLTSFRFWLPINYLFLNEGKHKTTKRRKRIKVPWFEENKKHPGSNHCSILGT